MGCWVVGVAFEGRMCVVVCFFGLVCFVVVFLGGLGFFDEWFCVVAQVGASDTRTLLDGVGEWVSRGSPPVGELPVVARCWSRGFV